MAITHIYDNYRKEEMCRYNEKLNSICRCPLQQMWVTANQSPVGVLDQLSIVNCIEHLFGLFIPAHLLWLVNHQFHLQIKNSKQHVSHFPPYGFALSAYNNIRELKVTGIKPISSPNNSLYATELVLFRGLKLSSLIKFKLQLSEPFVCSYKLENVASLMQNV